MKISGSVIYCLLVFSLSLQAQAPQSFKYQSVVRDNAGQPLTNQPVAFRISILQSNISGVVVYSERQTDITNAFGLVNLDIGLGTVLSGSFQTINWGASTYFIKIELDMTGGTSYINMGISQLISVPYALNAMTTNAGLSDILGNGNNAGTTSVNMNGQQVHSLANPTDSVDAVNVRSIQKGSLISGIGSGSANNYTVSLTPAPMGYFMGQTVIFKAGFSNTGPATLNVNGLGTKAIKKTVSSDLAANDILNGQMVTVIFDGVNFQFQGIPNQVSVANNGFNMVSFDVPGTYQWTVPAGVTRVIVEMWGAGGSWDNIRGTRGGSGAYGKTVVIVTPGQTIPVTVGAGVYFGCNSCNAGSSTFGSLTISGALMDGVGGPASSSFIHSIRGQNAFNDLQGASSPVGGPGSATYNNSIVGNISSVAASPGAGSHNSNGGAGRVIVYY